MTSQKGVLAAQGLFENADGGHREIERDGIRLAVERPLRVELDVCERIVTRQFLDEILVLVQSAAVDPVVERARRIERPNDAILVERDERRPAKRLDLGVDFHRRRGVEFVKRPDPAFEDLAGLEDGLHRAGPAVHRQRQVERA